MSGNWLWGVSESAKIRTCDCFECSVRDISNSCWLRFTTQEKCRYRAMGFSLSVARCQHWWQPWNGELVGIPHHIMYGKMTYVVEKYEMTLEMDLLHFRMRSKMDWLNSLSSWSRFWIRLKISNLSIQVFSSDLSWMWFAQRKRQGR